MTDWENQPTTTKYDDSFIKKQAFFRSCITFAPLAYIAFGVKDSIVIFNKPQSCDSDNCIVDLTAQLLSQMLINWLGLVGFTHGRDY